MKILELPEDEEEAYEAKALWTLEGMGILDSAIKEDDEVHGGVPEELHN